MNIDFNINLSDKKSAFLQDVSYDSKNLGADSSLVKQICKRKSGMLLEFYVVLMRNSY